MSKLTKTIAAFTGLAVAVMMFGVVAVPNAAAQTVEELQQQIADLQQMITQLQQVIASLGGSAAPSAPAGGYNFQTNLTIGSRGADVTALQQMLVAGGYLEMPAGVDYGYFGHLTEAAVARWQAANNISPAVGYFGPISRAHANAMAPTTPTTPTTPETPTTPALDGTDGSLVVSNGTYVSMGQTFKKGVTQNIMDARLQATGGSVVVDRVDVQFSERPWLTLNKLVLKTSSGTVLAEKVLTGPADVTEISVGTDYRVRFDGLNYVVNPGTEVTLVIEATSMASSDKIGDREVTVGIPAGSIRSINGRGFIETNSTALASKTFNFSSTGSVADLNSAISPNSPTQRTVTTSSSITPDVILGVYRLKAVNQSAEVSSMSFILNSSTGVSTSTLLSNLRLSDPNGNTYGAASLNGNTYGAASLTGGPTPTFSNMSISLPKDTWVDLTLKADIAANQALTASTTLDVSTVTGLDSNYNTLTLTNASDVTASDVVFTTGALDLVSSSAVAGESVYAYGTSSGVTNKNVDFIFTLKNNSNNVLYASTTVAQLVSTSSTGSATGSTVASSTVQSVSVSPTTVSGDSSTNYAIQPGSSRTFTLKALVSKIAGAVQYSELKITGINYSGTTVPSGTIDFGLENLRYGLSM